MTIKEAVERIKQAGNNVRITPTEDKKCKIEVNTGSGWATLLKDLNRNMAEDVIRQSKDKLLLG